MRLAAVSVDLDEVPCYTAIHGLAAPRDERAHAIYDRAVPRLRSLFEEEAIPVTFFAIGRDLDRAQNADVLRGLHRAGHEVGNHSLTHLYDFSRRDELTLEREVRGGVEAIRRVTGQAPTGFRAPGYTITDRVFRILERAGFLYDSSVFPCPPYYSLKAAAIAWIAARGRRSRSVVDDPRVLRAPADPYRVGIPYWKRGGSGMIELPIGVTRGVRLPYIGTTVVLGGELLATQLTRQVVGRPLVNLELHGIDLADAEKDDLGFLAPYQADLRRTADQKRRALKAAIRELRAADYTFVTLEEAARRFAAEAA